MNLLIKSSIPISLSVITIGFCFAGQSPMKKYKLILNAEMGEETIKGKLITSQILETCPLTKLGTLKS